MVLQYKCPSCGSDMVFDSGSGMLSCPSCGRQDDIERYKINNSEKPPETDMSGNPLTPLEPFIPEADNYNTFDENSAKEYVCNNCGATIITDKDTTATTCSFCGAGVVLGDRLSGKLAPTKVIPFSISKDQAQAAFVKWCKKGRLTPKGFMNADRIKSISGMYVPFWLYDMNGRGDVSATCTKVKHYTSGEYNVTETSYYDVYRSVDLNYMKIPADASEKMDDKLMDKLEPYDYGNLKEFNTPYLAGYIAEKYNYTDKDMFPRIKKRVDNYVDSYIRSTMAGYSSITFNRRNIMIGQRHADYTLLPVWMVCYDYKQAEHTFLMNGQTGKIVGKPPLSKGKIISWFAGVSGISLLIIKFLAYLIGGVL